MRDDTRGQVVQIAAIIVLAFAVLAFVSYQATVVPQKTAEAEQQHYETTTTELENLRSSIDRTTTTGNPGSASVRMSPQYDQLLFAMTPAKGAGTLRTEPQPGGIVIENAVSDGETGDYWSGGSSSFDTSRIVYRPRYNEFDDQPTRIYESSVQYDRFESGGEVVRTGQQLIRGSNIQLTAILGDLSASGTGVRTVESAPVSAPAERVSVTGDGANIFVRVPTQLTEAAWGDLLSEQLDANGGNVVDYGVSGDVLTLELDGTEEYDLQLSAVGVGENADDAESTYIVDYRGDGLVVPEGSTVGLISETRDQYDNAFAGEDVEAEVCEAPGQRPPSVDVGSLQGTIETSGDDGQSTFRYTAPSVDSTDSFYIGAAIDGTDPCPSGNVENGDDDPNRAIFNVTVVDRTALTFPIKINFQTPTTTTPTGYEPDVGDVFGIRGNGYTYGWSRPNGEYRERNDASDTRYDTLVHMDFGGSSGGNSWELSLPNGKYSVFLAMGDPTYTDSNHTVRLEDKTLVDETGTGDNFINYSTTVEVTDGRLTIEPIPTTASGIPGSSQLGNQKVDFIEIEELGPPFFEVKDFAAPTEAQQGDTITVNATVENTGREDTQAVEYRYGGTVVDSETVTLSPGEETTVEFTHTVSGDGSVIHGIFSENDSETATIQVDDATAFFDVSDFTSPGDVEEGDSFDVSATVENTGGRATTQDIVYRFDGNRVQAESVTLAPGQETTVEFSNSGSQAGEFEHGVFSEDDSETATIQVTPPAVFASLEGEVTDSRGNREAGEVTFSYELSNDASGVELMVQDNNGRTGRTDTAPASGSQLHEVSVRIDGTGSGRPEDNFPVTLTAEIEGGECYTTELENLDDVARLGDGDWNEC